MPTEIQYHFVGKQWFLEENNRNNSWAPYGASYEIPYGNPPLRRTEVIITNKICFGHFPLGTTVLPQSDTESRLAWLPWTPYGDPPPRRTEVIATNKICFGHFPLGTTVF